MPIKDILLPLVGEPSAAAIAAIDKCTAVAGDIGARVTAVAVEQDIVVRPKVTISIDPEEVRSVSNAHGLLQAFDAATNRFGVRSEQRLEALAPEDIVANIANHARLRDLAIVPVKSYDAESERIVEGLLFGSGRPVLLCPVEFAAELAMAFNRVAIAWDHTAPAARAVADALPMLKAAASVRVVTATDAKAPAELASGAALVSHLEGARNHGNVRDGENRRQLDRKGARDLCEGPRNRPSGHGCLSPFPAERICVGGGDKNNHRAAIVLGYDVALVAGSRTGQASSYPGRRQPGN